MPTHIGESWCLNSITDFNANLFQEFPYRFSLILIFDLWSGHLNSQWSWYINLTLSVHLNKCSQIKFPWRQWHPTPVLLPGKSHGWRSLVGCSPWGREESHTTEWLHLHFSLSCIGEGNGNPLQYSCLENPRDRGAWWATVYGVAQNRTQLKRVSSSSMWHVHLLIF